MRQRLEVGDRVIRELEIGSAKHYADFKRGTIVRIYGDTPDGRGNSNTLYAVRWDGDTSDSVGYLEVGLRREPLMIPTMRTMR